MPKMRLVMAIAVTIFCVACSVEDKTEAVGPAGPGPGQKPMRDVTNKSTCVGTPHTMGSIYRTWHMRMTNDQVTMDLDFNIGTNTTVVTSRCNYPDGRSLDASVMVQSAVNGYQLKLEAGENTSEMTIGTAKYSCSIAIPASTNRFDYVGNCLALYSNGQTAYMIP